MTRPARFGGRGASRPLKRAGRVMLAVVGVALGVAPAFAQTSRPTTAPASQPVADYEVREWAVFVFDGLADKLNANGVVTSSLPSIVPSRRTASSDADRASGVISPVGVIRFVGRPDERVDVNLSRGGGTFLASWPRAQERASGLLWRSLTLQDHAGGDGLVTVDPGSPIDRLRATSPSYVVDGKDGCEPFLLYDVELPYRCPLTVEPAPPNAVRLSNTGSVAVHDLTLFRRAAGVWMTAFPGELPPPAPVVASTRPAATRRASTGPSTTRAATRPAVPGTTLAAVAGADPDRLAADWATRRLPELSDGDRAAVAGLLARDGFDGDRLTAVYRLDPAEMDRLMPIEVLPTPRRIVRVGVVILRNIDLSAGTDVDDWIAQLGDNSWAKREAATKALTALGPVAIGKLRAAVTNRDPEVAWRAERIVAASGTP